ncbi:hypothetical protein LOTGIDRAFT_178337 [Lottia gigantea]|uniref:2-methoxy-6-polyprenyl-1,4-benzoquinol methylase, mitochondrial n=1 Tax=Lottia gigantea TaxID=225164 RepID=V4ANT6_LOTGI|nr:hypothetical protein LOTGIDRAFT_178337 [Lottia gigantea]ESO95311.1 hypothetical protein LOTGIDRAFT_178337 [Lottia gigantea]
MMTRHFKILCDMYIPVLLSILQQTHFGYQTVPEDEKEEKVYEVFENVASKYDLMNDAMSAGVHRLWKDHFIHRMAPVKGTSLIDVAGGTGDIAFRFLNSINQQIKPLVTVCDINQAMLDVGKSRSESLGYLSDVNFIKGNAECLPIENDQFDVFTIAYGIRNCTHIDKVIQEAYRVLKPGGRFMCLEFSDVKNPIIRQLYDSYSFQVIPVMGQVLASDWKSYQYLVESIRQFPNQEDFKQMIKEAGFKMVKYENLTFGVSAIHSGFKL